MQQPQNVSLLLAKTSVTKRKTLKKPSVTSRLLDPHGTIPPPVTGHALCYHNGCIYLFGGETDAGFVNAFYEYKIATNEWKRMNSKNNPPPKAFHSAVLMKGKEILVFGGKNKGNSVSDDVYMYKFKNNTWNHLKTTGNGPSKRFGHSAVVYNQNKMIIFGGMASRLTNDVYELHRYRVAGIKLPIYKWSKISKDEHSLHPPKRYFHQAAISKHIMYVFGGHSVKVETYLNDLWCFDLVKGIWKEIHSFGDFPLARYNHSSVIVGSSIFTFGGRIQTGSLSNVLAEFSMFTREWKKIKLYGDTPIPRGGHRAVVTEGHMYIFGGYREVTKKPSEVSSPLERRNEEILLNELYCLEVQPTVRGNKAFKKMLYDMVLGHPFVYDTNFTFQAAK